MADELGRADHEWQIGQESFVALSVAAAMAFHEAQGRSAKAVQSRQDHDDALNIAASALSRLLSIYAVDEATHLRVALKLDVLGGKFVSGATEFRRNDGATVRSMTVRQGDLTSALSLIRRVGIPFSLALGEAAPPAAEAAERRKAPEDEPGR